MSITREEALRNAAQKLDISPSKYKQAMERFASMSTYIVDGEYEGVTGLPEIYLQGSFKLGTEIRPYKDGKDADYDIDIVCLLQHLKESVSPKKVKHQVGDRLKEHGTYKKMLDDEGKRCWTLNYAEEDGIGFHMDILPSVHESLSKYTNSSWWRSAIAITNKCDENRTYNWSSSNPKGFAEWFYEKNSTLFESVKLEQKQLIFESYSRDNLFSTPEKVPNIHVKTPLQRAIQLLKRHRDIRFCHRKNEKFKPISMIITVLAARVYQNESTIYETLQNLIRILSLHAEQMHNAFQFSEAAAHSTYNLITRTMDNRWYIPNPCNPEENFADKWHEEENGIPHARAKAFFQWVEWAREDFVDIANILSEEHYFRSLISPGIISDGLSTTQSLSTLFDVPHRQKPFWPLDLKDDAQITAQFKKNSSWQKFNSGVILEKGCELLFRVRTDVPQPFQVYWQVVNTGKEAASDDKLRGEIFLSEIAGLGGLIRKEECTRYSGFHWIKCFIVKNSICVAQSKEFIVRIE